MKFQNASFSVLMGGDKTFAEKFDRVFHVKRGHPRCACPTPKLGYWLNKVPICAKCNGIVSEGRVP